MNILSKEGINTIKYLNCVQKSMGKCISKQPAGTIGNLGSASYIAISERSDELSIYEGQSESKKGSKKSGGNETKGTAMSFGFKKKFQSVSNKKSNSTNQNKPIQETEKIDKNKFGLNKNEIVNNEEETVIKDNSKIENIYSDDNGNTGSLESINDKNDITGRSTPRLLPPKKETSGVQHRTNRFGFRQSNVVRPASAGLTPIIQEFDNSNIINNNINNNNNNNNIYETRRSKSAPRSVLPNDCQQQYHQSHYYHNQNIQQYNNRQQQQFPKINAFNTRQNSNNTDDDDENHQNEFLNTRNSRNINKLNSNKYTVIDSGMHTNPIVRPTPQQAAVTSEQVSVSKFTLHTSSLPRPQYPVPISLTPRYVMDPKGTKQAMNNCRKGFQGPRDLSSDSGIASCSSFGNQSVDTGCELSPRRMRHKPRHIEMIMNGRHTFEVRDLDDSLSEESIIPLSLPQLPSAFNNSSQTAPLNGLVRTELTTDVIEEAASVIVSSASSDIDSLEEEKVYRDKSTSEKNSKGGILKNYGEICMDNTVVCVTGSKNSSPASSRTSWCNAGESMAIKDCSSFSYSSDESKDNKGDNLTKINNDNIDDEDISSVTITMGQPSLLSSLTLSPTKMIMADRKTFHDIEKNFIADETNNAILTNENTKFAEMAAAVSDILLDDETSPTDSLVSSCTDSDELLSKKNKKKINDLIKEREIDEITPELIATSPMTPGTPTHASNSFSLSDAARDFLIDDEIADQPELLFMNDNEGTHNDGNYSSHQKNSITENTPTLRDLNSESNKSNPVIKTTPHSKGTSFATCTPKIKPRNRMLTRTESLDTLSPCESICSDDMMMDFESNSSIDSIDRNARSNGSGSGSALHSLDEMQIISELSAQGDEVMKEWSSLLRVQRHDSRESITSQLPARATRLLNRSRLQQQTQLSNPGSESPRSLDSISRRTPQNRQLSAAHHLFKGGDSSTQLTYSPDDLLLMDKSMRNSMLQDLVSFKKQLIRLRRILQEDEDNNLTRTDTLNPFDVNNGQIFNSSCVSFADEFKEQFSASNEKELNSSFNSLNNNDDDPKQEMADLRRQVVYLQSQIDDKDRTIRIQQSLIDKYENDKQKSNDTTSSVALIETINTATQTERIRPLSMGQEGLASRSELNVNNRELCATTSSNELQKCNSTNKIPTLSKSLNSSIFPITQQTRTRQQTQISTTYSSCIKTGKSSPISSNLKLPSCISAFKQVSPVKSVKTTQIGNVAVNSHRLNGSLSPVNNNKFNGFKTVTLKDPDNITNNNKQSSILTTKKIPVFGKTNAVTPLSPSSTATNLSSNKQIKTKNHLSTQSSMAPNNLLITTSSQNLLNNCNNNNNCNNTSVNNLLKDNKLLINNCTKNNIYLGNDIIKNDDNFIAHNEIKCNNDIHNSKININNSNNHCQNHKMKNYSNSIENYEKF